MSNKDQQVKTYIIKHFNEMNEELKLVNDDFELFIKNKYIQKAVSFDLLQIGELFNNLSEECTKKLNKSDIRGIIDVRNYIAHGYIYIKNTEIWKTIHNDLPKLINNLQEALK